jgi:N-[(2S)-2-amino-2-carboxyethyl]-L-glutamate dehydrogenase
MIDNFDGNKQTGDSNVLAIGASDIGAVLEGKELAILEIIKGAYEIHGDGKSSLPHSTFLTFPERPANRIIALPAYLGGKVNSAGLKWIASFPENIERGVDRASAVLILNSMVTGRPKAILEGSIISTMHTAASAALAAKTLQLRLGSSAGLVGCGLINFEIARFLLNTCPTIQDFILFDLNGERAQLFQERCKAFFPGIATHVADSLNAVLAGTTLVSFATTAVKPHVADLNASVPGTVVLHVSLRDLSPQAILASDNVVDDVSHVCRAQTSVHLAEQKTGNTKFIRCTLSEILNNRADPRRDESAITVFSPFGLGILDVALGEYVLSEALTHGKGSLMRSFLPDSWSRMAVPA